MSPLNFPTYPLKLRVHNDGHQVFDTSRKKWVILTPEEWVRQHLAWYLQHEKAVPAGLLSIEKKLLVNGLSRRTDIVVFSRQGIPIMVCECKAPQIPLTQSVMDQAARYNIPLRVSFVLITNGLEHYCCRIDFAKNEFHFLPHIPSFEEMSAQGVQ